MMFVTPPQGYQLRTVLGLQYILSRGAETQPDCQYPVSILTYGIMVGIRTTKPASTNSLQIDTPPTQMSRYGQVRPGLARRAVRRLLDLPASLPGGPAFLAVAFRGGTGMTSASPFAILVTANPTRERIAMVDQIPNIPGGTAVLLRP
jgi:hypothetical protein